MNTNEELQAASRRFQTTELAHKLTQRLVKLPAEFAVILSRLAPGEVGSLLSRLDSVSNTE